MATSRFVICFGFVFLGEMLKRNHKAPPNLAKLGWDRRCRKFTRHAWRATHQYHHRHACDVMSPPQRAARVKT
ncbi:hypothetical protein HanPI659440_Chr06g0226231 [Helianthus annuus]|nr:hypothetical protein HanPI659440_Chr06g0226231 [Helianthus annuus]